MDKAARWGDLESEEEEEEEEEAEEEVSEDEATAEDTIADGLSSVASGYSSLPSGIETPDVLDLRKAKAAGVLPCAASAELEGPGITLHASLQMGQAAGHRPQQHMQALGLVMCLHNT